MAELKVHRGVSGQVEGWRDKVGILRIAGSISIAVKECVIPGESRIWRLTRDNAKGPYLAISLVINL